MSSKKLSYRKQIIKQLYFNKTLSCTGISSEIGKSIPYADKLVEELIQEGYIIDMGLAASTGGRRPLMYSLGEHILFVAVVVIDQYVTRIAVMDMKNNCVGDIEQLDLDLSVTENCFALIAEKLKTVIERTGIEKNKFAGVGIGIPDFVSSSEKFYNSFLNSRSKSGFANYISQSIDMPVFVGNNASLLGLAELRFGAAYKRKNAIVINIGWSFGLSLILNHELFRGSHDYAAEFNHLPLYSNNTVCSNGKTGYLETEASLNMLMGKAIKKLKAGATSVLDHTSLEKAHPVQRFENILQAVNASDHFTNQLFSEAGYAIGKGLAILVNLLSPELIVLSGRGSLAGIIWNGPVQSALSEHCVARLLANTELKISSLGNDAELIGAATLVMENFGKEKCDFSNLKKQVVQL